jgi:hypothetical protein
MLFNEIVKKDGIESIASKTNISEVNLEYLVEENFEKLNRVKALGFLLILEREYKDIDVSELREKVKAYYDENGPADDKVAMVALDANEGGGFSFFKLFILLALLGGGYYLYKEGKLDSLIQKIDNEKNFFDDKKALESNVSDESANKVVVGKSKSESVTIETPKVEEAEGKKKAVEDKKVVQQLMNTPAEENKSVEVVVKEVSKEFLENEAQSSPVLEEESTQGEEHEVNVNPKITTITINPTRGMLWFGFINIDTKKRREFMKEVSTPFNINDGRWLLVTGHGYLNIASDSQTLEIADNKKHYFYIDSNEIKEVSKREFRELNGRRGW